MTKIMTGAQVIVDILEKEGVKHIFGYPGATICSFYDALADSKSVKHILTRHEQGAAHAASGYARVTGEVGVCTATSGPGATNLITGIATAYMDSIPLLAITGQVQSDMIGRDVFQEADITGATAPFCKHNYLIKDVRDLPRVMKEAFHIAKTGRPGPVLIDVPIDIQNETLEYVYPDSVNIRGYKPTYKGNYMQIKKIAQQIASSKAPVICAGGGIINGQAMAELEEIAQRLDIPVVTTLMGIGAIDTRNPKYLGMLGTHGSAVANYAINRADLIIVMGARIADRAMAAAKKLAQKARIIHIDIDPAEIGKNVEAFIPVVGDVKSILGDLMTIAVKGDNDEWNKDIGAKLKEHLDKKELKLKEAVEDDGIYINPHFFLQRLSEKIRDDAIVTTEVGQNQIWAANNIKMGITGRFITSGGMGTMGYGMPSAIGAKVGMPQRDVIVISGDGSFQMSLQELGTIKQHKLGVKIVIMNNSRLGMVRELQKNKYCSRYTEVSLDENPDFVKLAGAYDIKGERISSNADVDGAIERLFKDDGAYLLECIVDPEESTL